MTTDSPFTRGRVIAAALTWALLSCTPSVRLIRQDGWANLPNRIKRIAVAPVLFSRSIRMRDEPSPEEREGATHVGHYLTEALLDAGVAVVAPRDTAAALDGVVTTGELHRDASNLARAGIDTLDVDALLVVELTHWSDLSANATAANRGAEVGFRVTLHGKPQGLLLWSGAFHEKQQALMAAPFRSLRYPGFGMRWLAAVELGRWGARRLVAEIPLAR